jgi:hypothetical protein
MRGETFIPSYHFYRTDCFGGRKGETAVAVRKGTPHNHVDLPPLVSIEATEVCIPTGNSEVLLSAVCTSKSPGHTWMMQTSMSSYALDISRYWQEI